MLCPYRTCMGKYLVTFLPKSGGGGDGLMQSSALTRKCINDNSRWIFKFCSFLPFVVRSEILDKLRSFFVIFYFFIYSLIYLSLMKEMIHLTGDSCLVTSWQVYDHIFLLIDRMVMILIWHIVKEISASQKVYNKLMKKKVQARGFQISPFLSPSLPPPLYSIDIARKVQEDSAAIKKRKLWNQMMMEKYITIIYICHVDIFTGSQHQMESVEWKG